MDNTLARWTAKVRKTDTCWLWTAARNAHGYGVLRLYRQRRNALAHRLGWELLVGPIPPGTYVLHRCDVPACVNPDHLWLGTQADNLRDAREKRRVPRGSGHYNALLSEADAREIYRLAHEGVAQRDLATRFGVSVPTVSMIKNRKRWVHAHDQSDQVSD